MANLGCVTVRSGEPLELARPQSGERPRERQQRAVEQLTRSIGIIGSSRESRELAGE